MGVLGHAVVMLIMRTTAIGRNRPFRIMIFGDLKVRFALESGRSSIIGEKVR